jgi:hypothetical protein
LFSGISDAATQFGAGWEIIDGYNKRAAAAKEYEAAQAANKTPPITTPAASGQVAAEKKTTETSKQTPAEPIPLNIPEQIPTNSNVTTQADLNQKTTGKPLTNDELRKLHEESQRAAEYELHPIENKAKDAWRITKKEFSNIANNVRHNLRAAWGIKDDISDAIFRQVVKALNGGKSVEEVVDELGLNKVIVEKTFDELAAEGLI